MQLFLFFIYIKCVIIDNIEQIDVYIEKNILNSPNLIKEFN